jgi:hypothetical protein
MARSGFQILWGDMIFYPPPRPKAGAKAKKLNAGA